MIVVRVELHSAVTGKKTLLGEMAIANDGTSTNPYFGDYLVGVKHKSYLGFASMEPITMHTSRTGIVKHHPRKKEVVWKLVLKALKACYPEVKF